MDIELFIPKGEKTFHRKFSGMPRNNTFYIDAKLYNQYLFAREELERIHKKILLRAIEQGAYEIKDKMVTERRLKMD